MVVVVVNVLEVYSVEDKKIFIVLQTLTSDVFFVFMYIVYGLN